MPSCRLTSLLITTLLSSYASVGGAQRLVVCLCVCFRRKLSRAHSPRPLKIKRWNLQGKLNTILSWNEIGGFWIGGFVVELWRDLRSVAHLDGYLSLSTVRRRASCLQRTAFNLVVPSVPQGRQWTRLNWDIQDVKGTWATSVGLHSMI